MVLNLTVEQYNKLYYETTKKIETPEHREKRFQKLRQNYVNKKLKENPNWKPKNRKLNLDVKTINDALI